MKPLEAWRIISANLEQLYKIRRLMGDREHIGAEIEAEVMCFEALRQMEKRSAENG